MAGVVVLDASALIALYSENDSHHKWALRMFVETAHLEFMMNVLNFSEALVGPARAGRKAQFLKNTEGLGIQVASLQPKSAEELADLRVSSGLRMPDSVVLLQAKEVSGAVATTDSSLAREAIRMGLEVYSPSTAE